jgi:hypothetical protein
MRPLTEDIAIFDECGFRLQPEPVGAVRLYNWVQ